MINALRWVGVVPAAVFGWYLALVIGLVLHSVLGSLCPPQEIISGMCTAFWYPLASRSLFCAGAALSAFFVVLFASLVSPSHSRQVAWVVYSVGAGVAVSMTISISRYDLHLSELISAFVAGLLAVLAVYRLSVKK
jgi:hypothetical protein